MLALGRAVGTGQPVPTPSPVSGQEVPRVEGKGKQKINAVERKLAAEEKRREAERKKLAANQERATIFWRLVDHADILLKDLDNLWQALVEGKVQPGQEGETQEGKVEVKAETKASEKEDEGEEKKAD